MGYSSVCKEKMIFSFSDIYLITCIKQIKYIYFVFILFTLLILGSAFNSVDLYKCFTEDIWHYLLSHSAIIKSSTSKAETLYYQTQSMVILQLSFILSKIRSLLAFWEISELSVILNGTLAHPCGEKCLLMASIIFFTAISTYL